MHVSPGLSRKFRGSTTSSTNDSEETDIAGSLHSFGPNHFGSLSRHPQLGSQSDFSLFTFDFWTPYSQQHRGKVGFPRTGSIISINSTNSNCSRLSLMAIAGKEKKVCKIGKKFG